MQLSIRRYVLPKAGNTETECEDACSDNEQNDSPVQHFAVADGATSSVFSHFWARLLVNAYSQGSMLNGNFVECLNELQEIWWGHAVKRAQSWYVREKIQEGAHATLIGLSLFENAEQSRSGDWTAFAVGDACLFHLRDACLQDTFPIASADGFSNAPFLVPSIGEPAAILDSVQRREGTWLPGDVFLLMTDALSNWLLANGPEAVNLIERQSESADDFRSLVDSLRGDVDENKVAALKNDDVTLLRIEIS